MDNKVDLCPKSSLQEEPIRSNHHVRLIAVAPNIAVNVGAITKLGRLSYDYSYYQKNVSKDY